IGLLLALLASLEARRGSEPLVNPATAQPRASAIMGEAGTGNTGTGDTGTGNSGIGNSGIGNSGIGNSGTGNVRIGNTGSLEPASAWQKRWWIDRTARLLRGGEGLGPQDDLDALLPLSKEEIARRFMADARFGDTILDFNLFYLGFK